MRKARVTA